VHPAQCHVTNTATWHVRYTLERQVVGWLHHQPNVGNGVADLLTLVETQAADDTVWNAEGD
jgi:hypothetical protein